MDLNPQTSLQMRISVLGRTVSMLFATVGLATPASGVDCGIDWTTTTELIGQDPEAVESSTDNCSFTVTNSNGEVITSEGNETRLKSVLKTQGIGTITWVYRCRTDDCPTPCVSDVALTTDDQEKVTLGTLTCKCCREESQAVCTCHAIPSLPAWGLIGLGVLLLAGGAVVFGRRRAREIG